MGKPVQTLKNKNNYIIAAEQELLHPNITITRKLALFGRSDYMTFDSLVPVSIVYLDAKLEFLSFLTLFLTLVYRQSKLGIPRKSILQLL